LGRNDARPLERARLAPAHPLTGAGIEAGESCLHYERAARLRRGRLADHARIGSIGSIDRIDRGVDLAHIGRGGRSHCEAENCQTDNCEADDERRRPPGKPGKMQPAAPGAAIKAARLQAAAPASSRRGPATVVAARRRRSARDGTERTPGEQTASRANEIHADEIMPVP
jgi:hypothetical protein